MTIKTLKKILITVLALTSLSLSVKAESLFTLGASQTYAPVPKSLYGGVQARSVGDLISIVMSEAVTVGNAVSYSSNKKSNTTNNFGNFINSFANHEIINPKLNNFGGANTVTNSAGETNKITFGDKLAVQVIQQMPNGNLVVQGKKTLVNANERTDLVVTGVVDPRWINSSGEIYSYHVANLQFALSGRGSVSRSDNEGIINRFIKYLF